MIFLDTHAVVWLYQKELHRFTPRGIDLLEQEELRVSPMALLELTNLKEIGRLRSTAADVFSYLHGATGLTEDHTDFSTVAGHAREMTWTRDPFDRIIVAHAEVIDAPLLTRDDTIHANSTCAVW